MSARIYMQSGPPYVAPGTLCFSGPHQRHLSIYVQNTHRTQAGSKLLRIVSTVVYFILEIQKKKCSINCFFKLFKIVYEIL